MRSGFSQSVSSLPINRLQNLPGVLVVGFRRRPWPRPNIDPTIYMSQHRSLRAASTLAAKRNVLKRFERVEVLKKRGEWKEGDRVSGLRKTKPE